MRLSSLSPLSLSSSSSAGVERNIVIVTRKKGSAFPQTLNIVVSPLPLRLYANDRAAVDETAAAAEACGLPRTRTTKLTAVLDKTKKNTVGKQQAKS